MSKLTILLLLLISVVSPHASGENADRSDPPAINDVIRIYLDADRTNAVHAGDAIEAGIQAAVHMHGGTILGHTIEIVSYDHHGNIRRSRKSFERFAADPNAIAIFCGLHSPPVLANLDYINKQELLTLSPWAAAAPITRTDYETNWVFRLSVDDSTAGKFIADAAIDQGYRNPGLLLEETGWGQSNYRNMSAAIEERLGQAPATRWFQWGVSEQSMALAVDELMREGADAIMFVGNTPEGITLANVLRDVPDEKRPPVFSHWGILGGNFYRSVYTAQEQDLDIQFIQTRFELDTNELAQSAFSAAQAAGFFPDIESAREMKAPTGFVHGYDLTTVLLAAIEQAGLTGDIKADRRAVRETLESLDLSVQGIIKEYEHPFSKYTQDNRDTHDALGSADYTLARFQADGSIKQVDNITNTQAAATED